jgi:hypothetical protein
MVKAGRWLGTVYRPDETPMEYSTHLDRTLDARLARWPWGKRHQLAWIKRVKHGIALICEAYVRASYSPHPVLAQDRRQVENQWRRLKWQMRWLSLVSRRR